MGVILQIAITNCLKNKLFPRYGGYSVLFMPDEDAHKWLFPIMGAILLSLLWLTTRSRLFPPLWILFRNLFRGSSNDSLCRFLTKK